MAEIDGFVVALAEKMLARGPRLLFATELADILLAALEEAKARERQGSEAKHGTKNVRGYERGGTN